MSTLEARRRVGRLIERSARRLLAAVDRPATQAGAVRVVDVDADPARWTWQRALGPAELAAEGYRVTSLLYERISPEKVAEVERRILETPELAHYLAGQPSLAGRRYLALTFGIWLAVPGLLDGTGLRSAQPPNDVHTMARGPLSAGGGLYEADMIASALESCGVELADVRDALDFGCSSGRVVRVMAAAFPQTSWHGCDPNAGAIAWATDALPEIDFLLSGDEPPLALADASLDLVCAISIWSHFEPDLGLRWFEEMHRVIRPGGHLVCTTHGLTSVDHYAERGLRGAEQSREIAVALYERGSWYASEFGPAGDWGVVNPAWGTAFLSPEWILANLLPAWNVLEFAPGRNQENQDVYVLRRV